METTKLELADGRRVSINTIYGSPQLVHGAIRDTLQIEFDPEVIDFNTLKAVFSDSNNLDILSQIIIHKNDDEEPVENKFEIGSGYTILASISNEIRNKVPTPGTWEPPKKEEVYVVTLSQETYAEHQLRILQNNTD